MSYNIHEYNRCNKILSLKIIFLFNHLIHIQVLTESWSVFTESGDLKNLLLLMYCFWKIQCSLW